MAGARAVYRMLVRSAARLDARVPPPGAQAMASFASTRASLLPSPFSEENQQLSHAPSWEALVQLGARYRLRTDQNNEAAALMEEGLSLLLSINSIEHELACTDMFLSAAASEGGAIDHLRVEEALGALHALSGNGSSATQSAAELSRLLDGMANRAVALARALDDTGKSMHERLLRSINHELFADRRLEVVDAQPTRSESLMHAALLQRRCSPLSAALTLLSVLSRCEAEVGTAVDCQLLALPLLPASKPAEPAAAPVVARELQEAPPGASPSAGAAPTGPKPWVLPKRAGSRHARNFSQRLLLVTNDRSADSGGEGEAASVQRVIDPSNQGAIAEVSPEQLHEALLSSYGFGEVRPLSGNELFELVLQQLIQADHAAGDRRSSQLQHRWADLLSQLQARGAADEGADQCEETEIRSTSAWIQDHGGTPDFYPAREYAQREEAV